MTLRHATVLASLLFAGPALAEGRSEAFVDLMGRVPPQLLQSGPGAWTQIHFADHEAAAAAMDSLPPGTDAERVAAFGPYARLQSPLRDFLFGGLEAGWEAAVGFGPLDVEAHLFLDRDRDSAMLLRLDPEAAASVAPALIRSGYAEEERDGVPVLVRGTEDSSPDFDARDPADPFGGSMGMSSRAVVEGSLVVQASGWPWLLGLLGADGPQGHPDLAPMAAAIDRPEWGDVALVNAVTMAHQLDLSFAPSGGIPPWRLGLLADLGSETETVTLALFSYTNRADAERAAARIAQGWDAPTPGSPMDMVGDLLGQPLGPLDLDALQSPPAKPSLRERTGAAAETGVAGDGPFVAWVALRAPPEARQGWPSNRTYDILVQSLYQRDLALFGPP